MNPTFDRRRLLGLLLVPVVAVGGCGSNLPADGTHLDLTVPKEQAVKQADAYKSYSKKPPGVSGSGSPSQRNRNRR